MEKARVNCPPPCSSTEKSKKNKIISKRRKRMVRFKMLFFTFSTVVETGNLGVVASHVSESRVTLRMKNSRRGWRETINRSRSRTCDDDRARLCAPCFRLEIAAGITLTQVHRALRGAFLLSLLATRQNCSIWKFQRWYFSIIFVEYEIRKGLYMLFNNKVRRILGILSLFFLYFRSRK